MKNKIKNLKNRISSYLERRRKFMKINKLLKDGFPLEMKATLQYLLFHNVEDEFKSIAEIVEKRRNTIARERDKKIPIWYSPKPGSAGEDISPDAQPKPGQELYFTMEQIAQTGKDKKWGTVLYLIAKGFHATTGIELGTCAGISAMYISSAKNLNYLITIEGSKNLSEIAKESLKHNSNVKVINGLFDEAIDDTLPQLNKKLDMAFIDGHHEKIATIHYFNKLYPYLENGSVVIFDDISWSYDMRECWDVLKKRPEFSHCIDLGAIGVCTLKKETDNKTQEPIIWDLQPLLGKTPIGDPYGWK